MKLKIHMPAGDNTSFATGAFDRQVGGAIRVRLGETLVRDDAVLVAAKVAPDGHSAELTIDVPDGGDGDEVLDLVRASRLPQLSVAPTVIDETHSFGEAEFRELVSRIRRDAPGR